MGTQGVRITSSGGNFKGSAEETFGVEIVVDDDNLKKSGSSAGCCRTGKKSSWHLDSLSWTPAPVPSQ